MDEPRSLDSVFKEKLFRIPDYQRGYAWGREQLEAFWEDLVNLPDGRSHYTGVLTLKEIPSTTVNADEKEFWLIDDHSYKLYHVVDGQQRLTTFIIFLQAFVELVRDLPDSSGKPNHEIYIADTLSIDGVQKKFLFMVKPQGDQYRTYKFGYTDDNPSYQYMRYRIMNEDGGGTVHETFYTLNLSNAKLFFLEQLRGWHENEGVQGLHELYRTLTKRFLFNEYIIKDEFDVFVAFETMNNRGKKLSDLELLKNRLIYLTTLYTDDELDLAERKSLRDSINDTWKEVYHQLGRNKLKPLNDDDFLRAHWTMYFKYSRQTGRDYIRFLLDEQFTAQRVHRKVVHEVDLEQTDEQSWEEEIDAGEEDVNGDITEPLRETAELRPTEIRDYVLSLKQSSLYWFASFYPELAGNLSAQETTWLQRLTRVGMGYFRPLVMAVLKNIPDEAARIGLFKRIERFIFIVFRMTVTRSNYRSSEFYNFARAVDRGEATLSEIAEQLDQRMLFAFDDEGHFRLGSLYNVLEKKFANGDGFYGWSGLRYFLYEYELSLLSRSRQKKVDWSDLLKSNKDTISIEHIYPQTTTEDWAEQFQGLDEIAQSAYKCSLGNLLLLSSAINSSLQNDSFEEKKRPQFHTDGSKARNGYADGSHSEIEVAAEAIWGPAQICARGMKLLSFMEKRWMLPLPGETQRWKMLFPKLASESKDDPAGKEHP
ncbi:MAG: DUF262 domain-containing protein [Planctomycetaceae bacterium]|nr:DUF262 domain-containing HNH endonuclease family protein [Planctomycetaceae bacterium]